MINDKLHILKGLGLSSHEAMAYLTLLSLGQCSATELARAASIKRPTLYLAIDELLIRGLATEIVNGRRKNYLAVHPKRLLEIANSRSNAIEKLLPELNTIHYTPKTKPRVVVHEGVEGVKRIYRELFDSMRRNAEVLFMTRIDAPQQKLPVALKDYKSMLRKLKTARIRELNYGDSAGIAWAKELRFLRRKNPHHKIRLTPVEYEFGNTDFMVFESNVAIFSYQKNISVILIENEEITKSFRAIFECAWQVGKVA